MVIRTQIVKKDMKGTESDPETQVRIIDRWAKEHRGHTLLAMPHTQVGYMIFVYDDGTPDPVKSEAQEAERQVLPL